jgi:microcystin-dependent protein
MDPFIGEIVLFAGNFAPRAWALCDGQLLAINSHSALFSILGTTYGGDGRTTFALPDLRGRTPVHPGHGPGLSDYDLGERGGTERVTLTVGQMPSHSHIASLSGGAAVVSIPASSANGTTADPGGNILAKGLDFNDENVSSFAATSAQDTNLAPINASVTGSVTVLNNGGSQYHTNIQPFLGINYIIALQGIFPSRN